MTPYYTDESVTLYHGDALTVLHGLPDASVDCCVTSPPYFGLRDYGVEGQYGLEASPAEYVETMRAVFAQVRRVLTDDGTLWLNLGDSYSATLRGNNNGTGSSGLDGTSPTGGRWSAGPKPVSMDRPAKNLLGIPWRVAFALQDNGWILRNAIVWHKPNAMPESVTDRLSTRYEHVFLFAKQSRYWFDLDPIREPHALATIERDKHKANAYLAPGQTPNRRTRGVSAETGANPGDVWSINTQPFSAAHFATMPVALAGRCIQAGCKPGGTVLDPFSGSGTTGLAAAKHGRKYVGVDLSAEYLDLSLKTRLGQPGIDFGEPA